MDLQELAIQVSKPGLLTQPQMLELYTYLGTPVAERERVKCTFNTKERESGGETENSARLLRLCISEPILCAGGSAKGPWEWDAKRCHSSLRILVTTLGLLDSWSLLAACLSLVVCSHV